MYAAIGAGMQAGGTAASAIGQAEAMKAMRGVWADARVRQGGFNDQIRAQIQELMGNLALKQQFGAEQNNALAARLGTGTTNAAGAVARQAARRPGAGGAEGRAVASQARQGALADALKNARLQAMLHGMSQGSDQAGNLAQSFGHETGMIRRKAQEWAGLVPMAEQAAGMQGAMARGVGSMFNTLGQGAMAYGMSQPAAGTGGAIPGGAGQAPMGGWAANRTYDLGGGNTGAWG